MHAPMQALLAPQTEHLCELPGPVCLEPRDKGLANGGSPLVSLLITAFDHVAAPGRPDGLECCKAIAGGVGSLVDGAGRADSAVLTT